MKQVYLPIVHIVSCLRLSLVAIKYTQTSEFDKGRLEILAVKINTIKLVLNYVICLLLVLSILKHVSKKIKNNNITFSVISISHDGYIRLTFEEFQKILLVHLISNLDKNVTELSQEIITFSKVTGYTEWISTTTPVISIGWDWTINLSSTIEGNYYKRSGQPRSNLMFINDKNCDIGSSKTKALIGKVVDKMVWESKVDHQIRKQYES